MKKSLLTLVLEFSGLEERFMRQPKLRLRPNFELLMGRIKLSELSSYEIDVWPS